MRLYKILVILSAIALRGSGCFKCNKGYETQQRHSALNLSGFGQTSGYAGTSNLRVGIGYDIHRVADPKTGGKKLKLGGLCIPDDSVQVLAHSDGDVVLHSISDAILGALGKGDIGDFFPDSNPEFRDLDSRVILNKVLELMSSLGYALVNLDVCIILEAPKLGPLKEDIKENLNFLLGHNTPVNVKAKTNEKLDAIGSGAAIACHSVVLLQNRY